MQCPWPRNVAWLYWVEVGGVVVSAGFGSMSATQARNDIRIFFWLPKTAGGTIAAGIRTNAGAKWLGAINPEAVPASSYEQIWVGGHTSFGDHLIYDSKPLYFTVLRDPIDRLISEFFYAHQQRPPELFIPATEIGPSFKRLVEAGPHLNYYSYMFSAYCFEKEVAERGLSGRLAPGATCQGRILLRSIVAKDWQCPLLVGFEVPIG